MGTGSSSGTGATRGGIIDFFTPNELSKFIYANLLISSYTRLFSSRDFDNDNFESDSLSIVFLRGNIFSKPPRFFS